MLIKLDEEKQFTLLIFHRDCDCITTLLDKSDLYQFVENLPDLVFSVVIKECLHVRHHFVLMSRIDHILTYLSHP